MLKLRFVQIRRAEGLKLMADAARLRTTATILEQEGHRLLDLEDLQTTFFRVIGAVIRLHCGVEVNSLVGRIRRQKENNARQLFCYLMRELGCTLAVVGKTIDRDHATVLHAASKIKRRMERSPEYAVMVDRMMAEIKQRLNEVSNAGRIPGTARDNDAGRDTAGAVAGAEHVNGAIAGAIPDAGNSGGRT